MLLEDYLARCQRNEETGCLTPKGAGKPTVRVGKAVDAKRWVYEQTYGVTDTRYTLHALCDNPRCVNPKHYLARSKQSYDGPLTLDYVQRCFIVKESTGCWINPAQETLKIKRSNGTHSISKNWLLGTYRKEKIRRRVNIHNTCGDDRCHNPQHMKVTKREREHTVKVSDCEVLTIRKDAKEGTFTQQQLAQLHGVTPPQISRIVNKVSRRGVTEKDCYGQAEGST